MTLVSNKIDVAEAALLNFPHVELPQIHRFAPKAYLREVQIPAGTELTTRRHKTTHHFVVLEGDCDVATENGECYNLKSGDVGITIAGTRRFIRANTFTRWLTFHVTDLVNPDEIAEEITEHAENPLIDPENPRLQTWRTDRNPSLIMKSPEQLKEAL